MSYLACLLSRKPLNDLSEFLAVARIVRPRGRRGEVMAEILTDFLQRFDLTRPGGSQGIYLERSDRQPEPAHLEEAWTDKGRLILKLSGINSIDEANSLRGLYILIRREERMSLAAHQYY